MADFPFKDAAGAVFNVARVTLPSGATANVSVPSDAEGEPLFSEANPGRVSLPGGRAKSMTVVTIPAYGTGGPVTKLAADGTSAIANVAPNTAVQVLGPNPLRASMRVLNKGLGDADYAYRANLAPGGGWPIAAASSLNAQGGGDDDAVPHTGAIYAASAAGTTLVVVEG